MDQKELTALLLLDLSKAFDCIEHLLLLTKLRALGLSRGKRWVYPSPFAEDLGVTIDASWTFDEHVTNLVSFCTLLVEVYPSCD